MSESAGTGKRRRADAWNGNCTPSQAFPSCSISPSDAEAVVVAHLPGRSTLFGTANAARLWLPQFAAGRRVALERLYNFIEPHDICPILPFPASDPRRGDALAEEYLTQLESSWEVDTRNIVYADESDRLGRGVSNWMHLKAVPAPRLADTCGSGDWCTAGLIAKAAVGGQKRTASRRRSWRSGSTALRADPCNMELLLRGSEGRHVRRYPRSIQDSDHGPSGRPTGGNRRKSRRT